MTHDDDLASATRSILARLPSFYRTAGRGELLGQFVDTFGQLLELAEEDLLRVMRAHYIETATNAAPGGERRGDLDRIFALYLERLGGTDLLRQGGRRPGEAGARDDDVYRRRILGLISVLRGGASTVEGIVDVIAANLGIAADRSATPAQQRAVRQARRLIRVEEFSPEPVDYPVGPLHIFGEFAIENPNAIPTPLEVQLRFTVRATTPLITPRVVNLTSGRYLQYGASDAAGASVRGGQVLVLFAGGEAMLDGVRVAPSSLESGRLSPDGVVSPDAGAVAPLELLPGPNRLRLDADVGFGVGLLDQTALDYVVFEVAQRLSLARFDAVTARLDGAAFALLDPIADVRARLTKITPASFAVRLPWHIPPFTEQFDRAEHDPRNHIQAVVDRVRAAGVLASVQYEQRFPQERHGVGDRLRVWGRRRAGERHLIEELDFDIGSILNAYPEPLRHEVHDSLDLPGIFDHTALDGVGFSRYDERGPPAEQHDVADALRVVGVFDHLPFDTTAFG